MALKKILANLIYWFFKFLKVLLFVFIGALYLLAGVMLAVLLLVTIDKHGSLEVLTIILKAIAGFFGAIILGAIGIVLYEWAERNRL